MNGERKRDTKIKCVALVTFLGMLMILMSGCTNTKNKVDWEGENNPGKITYSYSRFTGIEMGTIQGKSGETLSLTYDAKVKRGKLMLRVMGPDESVLWDLVLKKDAGETVELTLGEDGEYPLIIRGENTSGEFEVFWKVEP